MYTQLSKYSINIAALKDIFISEFGSEYSTTEIPMNKRFEEMAMIRSTMCLLAMVIFKGTI